MRYLLLLAIMFYGAASHGQSYSTGENWVTRYLNEGGDIRNITGLERPRNWRTLAPWDNMQKLKAADRVLPKSFDWNHIARLQPMKNQASCGSCWAFSVTAVTEALYKLQYYNDDTALYDLAEQTLVSSCESGGSCAGGYFSAFNYIRDQGLPDEAQDRYLASNSRCKEGLRPVQRIKSWAYVGDGNRGATTEQIKTAILNHGPVSVDVNGGFGSYSSGVYTGCGSTGTNHMVTIEGWVDDEQYAEYGGGYWIMRNSWGSNWGEDGYMRIVYKSKRGSNCNGIGNTTAYAVLPGLGESQTLREHMRSKLGLNF